MGFDDEVDDARKRLEAARDEAGEAGFDDLSALQKLLPALTEKIQSRRLSFALSDDEEDVSIEVVHTPSEEVLGIIYADEGEFAFESEQDGYFDDFVDDDAGRFVSRLYETLRADLPKFEVEQEE
ncbi:MAG: hypothetical protein AB7M12_11830 [Hyphomonadaceae bacterium]